MIFAFLACFDKCIKFIIAKKQNNFFHFFCILYFHFLFDAGEGNFCFLFERQDGFVFFFADSEKG